MTRLLDEVARHPPGAVGVAGFDVLARNQRQQPHQLSLSVVEVDVIDRGQHGEGVVDEALALWTVGKCQPEDCDRLFEWLYDGTVFDQRDTTVLGGDADASEPNVPTRPWTAKRTDLWHPGHA